MTILKDQSLKAYNTFGIDVKASFFIEVTSLETLAAAIQLKGYPELLLIGGGSNLLLTQDLDRLVLHLNLQGIEDKVVSEHEVCVKAMAGVVWHQLVCWSLEKNYGGLENLSLIPGNVGTAPIQNIGAYGVELENSFHSCQVMDRTSGAISILTKKECNFGYRDSIFKTTAKDRYIIVSVSFILSRSQHQKKISYGAITQAIAAENITDPTIQDIAKAVIKIRTQKLPDPAVLGNSGSFFKNPVIDPIQFNAFQKANANAPFYKLSETQYKIPAGWLIEACGFKGKRVGNAGVHTQQALVLVNYGNATGTEILDLAKKIQASVWKTFSIKIVPEVNIIK